LYALCTMWCGTLVLINTTTYMKLTSTYWHKKCNAIGRMLEQQNYSSMQMGSASLCYFVPDETPRKHQLVHVELCSLAPTTHHSMNVINYRGPDRQLSSFAFSRVRQPPSFGCIRQAPPGLSLSLSISSSSLCTEQSVILLQALAAQSKCTCYNNSCNMHNIVLLFWKVHTQFLLNWSIFYS